MKLQFSTKSMQLIDSQLIVIKGLASGIYFLSFVLGRVSHGAQIVLRHHAAESRS